MKEKELIECKYTQEECQDESTSHQLLCHMVEICEKYPKETVNKYQFNRIHEQHEVVKKPKHPL